MCKKMLYYTGRLFSEHFQQIQQVLKKLVYFVVFEQSNLIPSLQQCRYCSRVKYFGFYTIHSTF